MINKKLSSSEKKVLNEKLKTKNLFLPIDKYNLYLLPDSVVNIDGIVCDFMEFKKKTIDLIKIKLNLTYDIDVRFNSDCVELYKLDQGSFDFIDTIGCNELINYL